MKDRFLGSFLGLALADALGARFEGGILGSFIWKLVGGTRGNLHRWTDDTQMSMALAESLIEKRGFDADHVAGKFAERFERWRGYGPGAIKLIKRLKKGQPWREANRSVFPDGSFGNGAAMRAAPLGLFFHGDEERLKEATRVASSITHAHPLGIEGGLLIARAVSLALRDVDPPELLETLHDFCETKEFRFRLGIAKDWLGKDITLTHVRDGLGHGVLAHESAVTAVYAHCRFPEYSEMVEFIINLGGDTDTIGAMAGGIHGARYGTATLPREHLERLEMRDGIEALASKLHEVAIY